MKKQFGEWLTRKYLEWQLDAGRGTITEFAQYLGCPQQNVSRWMAGQSLPDAQNVINLERLGLEVYDLVGLPRPDPDLVYLKRNWDSLPNDRKKAIARIAREALGEYK